MPNIQEDFAFDFNQDPNATGEEREPIQIHKSIEKVDAREIRHRIENYLDLIRGGREKIRTQELEWDSLLDAKGNKLIHVGKSQFDSTADVTYINENPLGAIDIRCDRTGIGLPPVIAGDDDDMSWRAKSIGGVFPTIRIFVDHSNASSILTQVGAIRIEEGNASVVAACGVIDFNGDDFKVTPDGSVEADVEIDRVDKDGAFLQNRRYSLLVS